MDRRAPIIRSVLSILLLLIVGAGCASQTPDDKRAQIAKNTESIEVIYPPDENAQTETLHIYRKGDKEFGGLITSLADAPPFTRTMAQSLNFRHITILLNDGVKIRLAVCIADGKFRFLDENDDAEDDWLQFPMSQMHLIK